MSTTITYGRSSDNTHPINDPKVSRHHCGIEIDRQRSQIEIIDYGSLNGTFVNGHRISGRQTLQTGDVVRIGDTVIRWAEDIATPPTPPTPPAPPQTTLFPPQKTKSNLPWILAIVIGVVVIGAVVAIILLKSPNKTSDITTSNDPAAPVIGNAGASGRNINSSDFTSPSDKKSPKTKPENFEGDWLIEVENVYGFMLTLTQNGDRLSGSYCYLNVEPGSEAVDCSDNNQVSGTINGDHAELNLTSETSGKGKASITISEDPSLGKIIRWSKFRRISGEIHCPSNTILIYNNQTSM